MKECLHINKDYIGLGANGRNTCMSCGTKICKDCCFKVPYTYTEDMNYCKVCHDKLYNK